MAIKDEIMFLIKFRKKLEELSSNKDMVNQVFVDLITSDFINKVPVSKEAIETVYEIYDIKVGSNGKVTTVKPAYSGSRGGGC